MFRDLRNPREFLVGFVSVMVLLTIGDRIIDSTPLFVAWAVVSVMLALLIVKIYERARK